MTRHHRHWRLGQGVVHISCKTRGLHHDWIVVVVKILNLVAVNVLMLRTTLLESLSMFLLASNCAYLSRRIFKVFNSAFIFSRHHGWHRSVVRSFSLKLMFWLTLMQWIWNIFMCCSAFIHCKHVCRSSYPFLSADFPTYILIAKFTIVMLFSWFGSFPCLWWAAGRFFIRYETYWRGVLNAFLIDHH